MEEGLKTHPPCTDGESSERHLVYLPWQNSSLSSKEAGLGWVCSFQGDAPNGPSFPLPLLQFKMSFFEGQEPLPRRSHKVRQDRSSHRGEKKKGRKDEHGKN